MKTKKKKNHKKRTTSHPSEPTKAKFIEHLHELRRRAYYVISSVAIWAIAAYFVQQRLVNVLLRPSKGQHFIYTSVGGGIDFLFRICIYSGIVFSLPIIIYNVLKFIEPTIKGSSKSFILLVSSSSLILAAIGIVFGYYFGLPTALHFLLHQFRSVQIQPLVTIQSYLSFVLVYMAGAALLFQLPLILVCINRIKPLKPGRLFHHERWVILGAFVLSGLMNPTPNILSQLIVAVPFIVMYQFGILLIAFINRPGKLRAIERAAELRFQSITGYMSSTAIRSSLARAVSLNNTNTNQSRVLKIHVRMDEDEEVAIESNQTVENTDTKMKPFERFSPA